MTTDIGQIALMTQALMDIEKENTRLRKMLRHAYVAAGWRFQCFFCAGIIEEHEDFRTWSHTSNCKLREFSDVKTDKAQD